MQTPLQKDLNDKLKSWCYLCKYTIGLLFLIVRAPIGSAVDCLVLTYLLTAVVRAPNTSSTSMITLTAVALSRELTGNNALKEGLMPQYSWNLSQTESLEQVTATRV